MQHGTHCWSSSHVKVNDDRFVAEFVCPVIDSVAAIDDDLPSDVKVVLEDLPHLALRTLRTFVAAMPVSLDPVEDEVIAPRAVHLV